MASLDEDREIEKFIRPIRNLYSDYATTIAQFKEDNGVLLTNYDLEDLGDDKDYKLYAEFSEEGDGELAKELVQTWICDNRLEVTNCVRIALENRKQPFCNWYRDSEKYTSPDELLLYCLGKQTNKHVSIFNSKYVWSTLSKHISYDYFEILHHSHVLLVMLGERHYAIFRKKKEMDDTEDTTIKQKKSGTSGRGRGRGKKSAEPKRKTVCRSSGSTRRDKTTGKVSNTNVGIGSHTLESARKKKFGIGKCNTSGPIPDTEKYGRGKRTRGQSIDYSKLNEGLEEIENTSRSGKKSKHVPVRSGPTPHRQSAQKLTTETPMIRTLSTVKSKKDTANNKETEEISVSDGTLIGVPPTTTGETTATSLSLLGVPSTTYNETATFASHVGVKDAFLGVPEMDNLLLPDLGYSKDPTQDDVVNQMINTEPPPEVNTTEDELDAADALLSLSSTLNVGSTIDTDLGMEDNALLVPIGGRAICEDIAPTDSKLDQMAVDSEIAKIIESEEHTKLGTLPIQNTLLGVQDDTVADGHLVSAEHDDNRQDMDTIEQPTELSSLIGVQTAINTLPDQTGSMIDSSDPTSKPSTTSTSVRPKVVEPKKKTGTRGAFKSQLFGLRRKVPKDRSYKCQICGKSKRSMEALNEHHRGRHDPQKCSVCGKVFDLATTLAHHMYSHYTRKFHCDQCNYHCFFQSELESHKIVHRERPTYQCQYPKCGKWFKRKGELSLHVEVHDKTWYDCKKCDFSTKLMKYLKEHEKSHLKKNEDLPYECKLCGERFLWRSGLKRHRERKHAG